MPTALAFCPSGSGSRRQSRAPKPQKGWRGEGRSHVGPAAVTRPQGPNQEHFKNKHDDSKQGEGERGGTSRSTDLARHHFLKPFGTCLSLRRLNDNSGRPAERGKDQTENSSDVPTQGFYKRTKLAFHLPAKASVVPRKAQRPPDTGSFQSLNTVTS